MNMRHHMESSVVIVGAGPVGLGMAIELSQRGIDCTVIDEGDGHVDHPRTGLVAVRTMELFRRWGLASAVRQCGFPEDYTLSMVFCTSLNGWLLGREDYPSMRNAPTPDSTPEKKQRCPQMWLQPILADAARSSANIQLLYQHRCTGMERATDGVCIQVTSLKDGNTLKVEGRYLLACDGAASSIRQQMGIEMEGRLLSHSVNILFRAPDLTKHHPMGQAERYMFVGPDGMWGNLTVVDGRDIWRLTVLGSGEKMNLESFNAREWVLRALGTEQDPGRIPFDVMSVIPWRRAEMLAKHYVKGRVLLVGDSAHSMSPTGGMGMNTGMQEVLDLGWKLQGMFEGWGGNGLLDSYDSERRPIAARNISFSTQNFRSWQDTPNPQKVCDNSPQGSRLRNELGTRLRDLTRVEWESMGLQIGHRYVNSPICVADGTLQPPDDFREYVPSTWPGARAPHAWLADGRSTLDLFGHGFVLVQFDDCRPGVAAALESAFAQRKVPFQTVSLTNAAIRQLYERPLVLVRPDGHVAWRGENVQDAFALVDTVRGARGNTPGVAEAGSKSSA
ncbi:MAG: FAD-dependent monooxygenase [Gallionellaceae bacterium]|jgi:2-polyprenyl-6-methoxyphenol hydroxylase-like FAD-dependent oxidoreductase|nr:FAD-dependent monooxygenase [Gallionellaceae bacterium]